MPSYGSYNTTEELGVHGFISAYRAARATGEGAAAAVVKVLNTKGDGIIEPANPEEMVVEFLDGARVQQRAGRESRHWANVYETGLTAGGAYYAIEYFDRSVQRLLDMRVRFTAGHLFCLVEQAAQGLIDLQKLSERAHGNLKASNLLIRGQWPDGPNSVVLTDPLPSALLTPHHGSEDLESLGRLIYQCVTRTPIAGRVLFPVSDSPDWAELGRRGSRLRDLCNLLLDPEKRPEAKFAQLRQHLTGRDRSRKVFRAAAAFGLVAILCTGGWGYVHKYGVPFASIFSKHEHPIASTRTTTNDQPVTRSTTTGTGGGGGGTTEVRVDVVRELMAANNPDHTFTLKLDAKVYESTLGNGPCVALTITPGEDCYAIVACQDSAGKVTLLVPNGQCTKCPRLWKDAPVLVQSLGFELPVQPPYGKTVFKVIASTRQIEFIGAMPNASTGFLEGVQGLSFDNPRLAEPTIAKLLKPEDWATAQAEIVTQPPKSSGTTPAATAGGS